MAIYMQYPGADGEVTESGHTNWIELVDAQFSTSRSIRSAVGVGTNRESSSAYVSEVTVTKLVDKSSHPLTTFAFTGKPVTSDVQIDFTRTDGSGETVFRSVKLTDVVLSSLVFSGHKSDRPSETLSLNFTKIEVTDTSEAADGSTSPTTVSYNLATSTTG